MKRGRSTGTPTKEEVARIVACKEGRCVACWIQEQRGLNACDGGGCDYHHMKSGNIRRGHMYGIGLCVWHHRGHPSEGYRDTEMRAYFGVSLMDGSRAFHQAYGTDDELLGIQDYLIDCNGGIQCSTYGVDLDF